MSVYQNPNPPARTGPNRNVIIAVVVGVVVLCCCCAALGLAWQYGDAVIEMLGM
jgi:hypothetical protein